MVTMEAILSPYNLSRAVKQVVENRGSPGVDGMEVSDLKWYLATHPGTIMSIKRGTYTPSAVRRVLIPKAERGQFRPLGIPTVVDRFVQQAVAQVLSEEYDCYFSDSSHAYRPDRSCHTAMDQVLQYANSGLTWVVDLDLAKFFDTVNHSKLIQLLSERVKDGRVISLVNKFLRAPIREGDTERVNEMGTPQGGCVSPVLANILLDELDKELEKRGHKFARYADDVVILCGSKRAATRTLENIRWFIEKKLFLRINEQKTKICYITSPNLKFLGFGFIRSSKRRDYGKIICYPHKESKRRFREKLRKATSRSRGQSLEAFRLKVAQVVRGWVNYYRIGSMSKFLRLVSKWLRRRIRQIYWKIWKTIRMRRAALLKMGVSKELSWQWANTRRGYWRVAGSMILETTLTNERLKKLGWICPEDIA